MLSPQSQDNTQKNRQHYYKRYSNIRIIRIKKDVDAYLDVDVDVESDTSGICICYGDFREEISGKSYNSIGLQFFTNAGIHSVVAIGRLHRLALDNNWKRKFRIFAIKLEKAMLSFMQYELARTQTIIYKMPLQA